MKRIRVTDADARAFRAAMVALARLSLAKLKADEDSLGDDVGYAVSGITDIVKHGLQQDERGRWWYVWTPTPMGGDSMDAGRLEGAASR